MAPGKRKRSERQQDDGSARSSPHRPETSRLFLDHSQTPGGHLNGETVAVNGDAGNKQAASNITPTGPTETTPPDSAIKLQFSRPAWRYITDDLLSSWAAKGPQHLTEQIISPDELGVSELIQELVWSGLNGRLSGQQAGQGIRDMISSRRQKDEMDVQYLFLNTIALLDEKDHINPNLRAIVAATGIDPQDMRQELDIPLLQALNLVRSTFEKMRTRKTTNALYRQANFNLLREESEGYAKLITEYFNTAQEASSRREEDPYMAEDAFQRVKALVGAFDLDVGRVLDITLDVSASLLVKAYPFFMKFYRASSWWPENGLLDHVKWEDQGFSSLPNWALPNSGRSTAREVDTEQLASLRTDRDVLFWKRVKEVGMDAFFEIGSRQITNYDSVVSMLEIQTLPELDSRGKETDPNKRQRLNEDRKYMLVTRTLPPSGNYDAAQLLGFKLRFYASEARDTSDTQPDNVVYLAALLIKIGFISLRDLYPHLHPPDKDMPQEKIRLQKEKAEKEARERPGGGRNALTMLVALTDDTVPTPRVVKPDKDRGGAATPSEPAKPESAKPEAKDELPDPGNQKILLLKALLLIGALPEALYILGRFPWLMEVDSSLPPYLHRIARHMLSQVADFVRPPVLSDRPNLQEPKNLHGAVIAPPINRSSSTNKKGPRWLYNDGFDKELQYYRHYYADWSNNIPVCQNLEDVFLLINTFLGYLGVKIGQDAFCYTTLLRLAKNSLVEDTSSANKSRWLELMRRLLVPALSLSKHSPDLDSELYELLALFPTQMRYNIYAEWFTGRTSRLPDMRVAFDRNKAEVRDVLRRVSNDSGKKQSRALAKVSYASPGIVMMEMISQLESYSNMIPSLVECTRYFSFLAYDVLTWCLINSMGGQGKNRIQADGMLTSAWLQALSQFVASLFARYSHLNPSPVLQYLAWELRAGNSTDLAMFEQILVEMAGIRSDVEFNDAQVIAMAGGERLQSHIMQQLSDTRHAKKGSAKRLMKALADPGLIGPMVISIAQERQMYSTHESSKYMPLKVLGNNLDKIQAVFAQYIEVLKVNLTPEEFEQKIPDVISLVGDFGIEPGVAFTICRTAIRHYMSQLESTKKSTSEDKKERPSKDKIDASGDIHLKDATDSASNDNVPPGGTPGTNSENGVTATVAEQEKAQSTTQKTKSSPWHPALESIIQRLPEALPELHNKVSIPFYVTFWTLTHQDVLVPTDSYKREMQRLEAQVAEIQNDRTDVSSAVAKEREKKKLALHDAYDKLKNEPTQHLGAYINVRNRISKKEKYHWFPKSEAKDANELKQEIEAKHLGLLQECFLPRAMMSSVDAHYSFLMLKILHDNGTPGFSLMHLLHQLFRKRELTALMFQYTAMEAQHFGRFLNETMKLLHRWHGDKTIYDKEALGGVNKLPGFVKKFDPNGDPKLVMDYEDFRRMLYNFHAFVNVALQSCFESNEYMHIRNGIIVLKSVHQVFPALKFMGKNMVDHVKKLSEDDPRQDLKLAAMSLLGPLKSREKHWVLPQAFRMNAQDANKDIAKAESRTPSAKPESRQAGNSTPKLSAIAPEFKPNSSSPSTGPARKESVAGKEDGEIEDEKEIPTKDAEMKDVPSVSVSKPDSAGVTESISKKETQKPTETNLMEARPSLKEEARQSDQQVSARAPTPVSSTPDVNGSSRQEQVRPPSTQQDSGRPPPRDTRSRPDPNPPMDPPHNMPTSKTGGRYASRGDHRPGRHEGPNDAPYPATDQSGPYARGRTPPGAAGRASFRDERQFDRPPFDSRSSRDNGWQSSRPDRPPQAARPPLGTRDRLNTSSRWPEDAANQFPSVASGPDHQHLPRQSYNAPHAGQPRMQEDAHHAHPARRALMSDPPSNTSSPRRGRDGALLERDHRGDREFNGEERTNPHIAPRNDHKPNGRLPEDRPEQQSEIGSPAPKRAKLSRDAGSSQESSYGRLNAPQDTPVGPRRQTGPSGRGRNFSAAQPTISARVDEPSASSPSNSRVPGPPTSLRGPNSRLPSASGQQHDIQNTSNSAPGTPADENGPPVHPSRAKQLGQPPPVQTNFPGSNGPSNTGSPVTAPPSGPRVSSQRGPAGSPTGTGMSNNLPPIGPTSATERQKRGDRQRANINATLQGATNLTGPSSQGVSFRGASTRQPSASAMPPQDSRSNVPTVASSMEPPLARSSLEERSSMEQLSNNQPPSRPDLFQSKPDRDGGAANKHAGEDGTDRQHGSRDLSRELRNDINDPSFHPPPIRPGDERALRGAPRTRRGGPPRDERSGPPRDRRHAERQPEQQQRMSDKLPRRPPGDTPPSFSGGPEWDHGSYGRGARRDGPDGNRRGRGGNRGDDFRSGPRRGDYESRDGIPGGMAEDTGMPDNRKRRHDDTSFDPTKRRRGGR